MTVNILRYFDIQSFKFFSYIFGYIQIIICVTIFTNVTLWRATRIQQDFLLTRVFFSRLSIVKDITLLRLSIMKGITLSKQR